MAQSLGKLTKQNDVDIIILAENVRPAHVVAQELRRATGLMFYRPYSLCDKISVFTRLPKGCLTIISESTRTTIQNLALPARPELLLAALHLPSQLHTSKEGLAIECTQFSQDLREAEQRVGHNRTILVGDFNLNPFDSGLVSAGAINAVMTRKLAERGSRTVQGRKFDFFYNPMWSHFGDADANPPGTYYYEDSDHVAFFWHIFDQVLFRPELLKYFRNENLKILTSDGESTFLTTNGTPDKSNVSDHLPILFRIDM